MSGAYSLFMLFAVWVKLEYCINFVKIMIAIFSFSFVQSLKLYNCRGKVYESGANVSISLNTFYDMICIGSGCFAVFYILNFSKTDAHIPRISTNTNP